MVRAEASGNTRPAATKLAPSAVVVRARALREAGNWAELSALLSPLQPSLTDPELVIFLAEARLRSGNPHDTVALTSRLVEDLSLDSVMRARGLIVRSVADRVRGFVDKALEDALTADAIVQEEPVSADFRIECRKQLGILYQLKGDLDRAIENLERGLRLCARSSRIDLEADINTALGIALARQGQLSEAQAHFVRALAAYEKLGRTGELSEILNNLGKLMLLMGEQEQAVPYLERALRLAQESRFPRIVSMTLINLGDSHRESGQFREAIRSYQGALSEGGTALEPRLTCCAHTGLGITYSALGDAKNATHYLRLAMYEARRLGMSFELATATVAAGVHASRDKKYSTAAVQIGKAIEQLKDEAAPVPLLHAYLALCDVLFQARVWAELRERLKDLARLAGDLALGDMIRRRLPEYRAVIEYASSKRIGGTFYRDILHAGQPVQTGRTRRARTGDLPALESSPRIVVRAFGTLEIEIDGRVIASSEWRSKKAQELFVYLLTNRSGATKEELIDVLWPEISMRLSRNAFYTTVYRARRALYSDVIAVNDGRYRLDPQGEFKYDLEDFYVKGRSAMAARSLEERAKLLNDAIALHRSPFMDSFYADWIDMIRSQTEALQTRNLQELARAAERLADPILARRCLEELLRVGQDASGVRPA